MQNTLQASLMKKFWFYEVPRARLRRNDEKIWQKGIWNCEILQARNMKASSSHLPRLRINFPWQILFMRSSRGMFRVFFLWDGKNICNKKNITGEENEETISSGSLDIKGRQSSVRLAAWNFMKAKLMKVLIDHLLTALESIMSRLPIETPN